MPCPVLLRIVKPFLKDQNAGQVLLACNQVHYIFPLLGNRENSAVIENEKKRCTDTRDS